MAKRYTVIEEIRRANLRALAERFGADELRMKIGVSRQRLSALLTPHAERNIGSDLSRRIEQVLHYPRGWMDHQHAEEISDFEKLMAYCETVSPERFTNLVRMIRVALSDETLASVIRSAHDNKSSPTQEQQEGKNGDAPNSSAGGSSPATKRATGTGRLEPASKRR